MGCSYFRGGEGCHPGDHYRAIYITALSSFPGGHTLPVTTYYVAHSLAPRFASFPLSTVPLPPAGFAVKFTEVIVIQNRERTGKETREVKIRATTLPVDSSLSSFTNIRGKDLLYT